jgi:hypothetical protein
LPTFKKKCELAKEENLNKSPIKSEIETLERTKEDKAKEVKEAFNGTDKPIVERMCLYAKMEANYHLSNKKALFWNMTNYYKRLGKDPFDGVPLTFHVENGTTDPEFINFKHYFSRKEADIKLKKEALVQVTTAAKKAARK